MFVKGYLAKLLGRYAVKSYIACFVSEILTYFNLGVNTFAVEDAKQYKLGAYVEYQEISDGKDSHDAENAVSILKMPIKSRR